MHVFVGSIPDMHKRNATLTHFTYLFYLQNRWRRMCVWERTISRLLALSSEILGTWKRIHLCCALFVFRGIPIIREHNEVYLLRTAWLFACLSIATIFCTCLSMILFHVTLFLPPLYFQVLALGLLEDPQKERAIGLPRKTEALHRFLLSQLDKEAREPLIAPPAPPSGPSHSKVRGGRTLENDPMCCCW